MIRSVAYGTRDEGPSRTRHHNEDIPHATQIETAPTPAAIRRYQQRRNNERQQHNK